LYAVIDPNLPGMAPLQRRGRTDTKTHLGSISKLPIPMLHNFGWIIHQWKLSDPRINEFVFSFDRFNSRVVATSDSCMGLEFKSQAGQIRHGLQTISHRFNIIRKYSGAAGRYVAEMNTVNSLHSSRKQQLY